MPFSRYDKHARRSVDPPANQSRIDSIMAELGRHAGDAGEKKRVKALEQQRPVPLRKRAKPTND
jgi:hypothetical protein